jgi:hypothetical protein
MRESFHRSNFYGFGVPVLIVVLIGIFAISSARREISGAISQARTVSVTHFFDEGVSVWHVRLR